MSLDKVKSIINDIQAKKIKPIYFLMGEEPYYIDVLSKYIEDNVLSEEEKGFNQMVLYGRDVAIQDVISQCKRYPLGAEKQVVILKEAQSLSRSIEDLVPYAENPQPSTVLVVCYKYKSLDKRKKLSKQIAKTGVLFESKKLYENQIPDWIKRVLAAKGYIISQKASLMLVEFLGTDLNKINNELEKLQLILKPGAEITDKIIEDNIGISKDFNNFELQNAIGRKDMKKAFAIIQYFSQNPRNNPIQVTISVLYNFFSKLLIYHALSNKSEAASALGVHPFFLKEYEAAAGAYPMRKVSAVIEVIRDIDLKSKGVGASISQEDLLKELLIGIFS